MKRLFLFAVSLLIVSFYPSASSALTCFPGAPSNLDIIKAPIIFEGIAREFVDKKDTNGKVLSKYIKFDITRVYKGPELSTIDIKSVSIVGYPPNIGLGSKITLMPDKLENGELGISYCSKGLRSGAWTGLVAYAYEKKLFPTLYLISTYKPTRFYLIGILILWIIVRGSIWMYRRKYKK